MVLVPLPLLFLPPSSGGGGVVAVVHNKILIQFLFPEIKVKLLTELTKLLTTFVVVCVASQN